MTSAARAVAQRVSSIGKFGVVGIVAFAVDIGIFNLLRWDGALEHRPLMAKVISTCVATVVSWLGNRLWTFRHQRRAAVGREFLLFVTMCTVGLLVSLGCLGFSHYVLNLTSPLADNISANLVGVALASVVRYWGYSHFVFTAGKGRDSSAVGAPVPVGDAA